MDDPQEIIESVKWLLAEYGVVGLLVFIIILLLLKPEGADLVKSALLYPTYRLFRWGPRRYLATKIGYSVTRFFNKHVNGGISSSPEIKVKLKWVRSPEDPVLKNNGTLIVCMRESNDQNRNILTATQASLPYLVCPSLRPNIKKSIGDAMDLTILRKLALSLNKAARPVFTRYFLGPATERKETLRSLYSRLVELDHHGTFVSIFLEELHDLGERLLTSGNTDDQSEEIENFLSFLVTEARRKEREEIKLDYFSKHFRVALLILAKTVKVSKSGVHPYLKRIDQKVKQGCDTIYVIAYSPAIKFMDRLLRVVKGDNRIDVIKVFKPHVYNDKKKRNEEWRIAQLRTNSLFDDTTYRERAESNGVIEGAVVAGVVLDVSENRAFVDIGGLNGVITRAECGWQHVSTCQQVLKEGESREFAVKEVEYDRALVQLSLKHDDQDPWNSDELPSEGELVEAVVMSCDSTKYYCLTDAGIQIELPSYEVSWNVVMSPTDTDMVGKRISLRVGALDEERRLIQGSIRRLSPDPWPDIHKGYPKGTRIRGTVAEIRPGFVIVDLPNGVQGVVRQSSFENAGFEYADFESTVVPGQSLDLVVTKVFIKRQHIRLDLERNLT